MFKSHISFVWVILLCGVVCVLFIIGNLSVLGLHRYPDRALKYVPNGDPEIGRVALETYGCGSCHVIPGVTGATGRVGPKLEGIEQQIFLAGVLTNTPENMIRWIQDPRGISKQTAMPNLGVTPDDARHMAAYLYSMSERSILSRLGGRAR